MGASEVLDELHVRDLALIEEVHLEFGPGMTVLTGETGAGKTALVGAIKLLVGERADATMVRAGAAETVVQGRIARDGREIIARRRVNAEGRSRCTLDGEMATVGNLALTVGPLFDLHGQHEHQALLHPGEHAGYLERFIGEPADAARAEYIRAFREFVGARDDLERLEARSAEDRERADYLRFVVDEITSVAPRDGEDAELEARLPALRHGERLTEAAGAAYASMRSDGGASDALAEAEAALARVAGLDPRLDALAEELSSARLAVDELAVSVRDYAEGIEHDPRALNVVEARLAALAALKKKYGPDLEAVLRTQADARDRLDALDSGEEGREAARAALARAREAVEHAGAELARVRREAETEFLGALVAEASELGMHNTRFGISFGDLPFEQWTEDGPQRVEFLCAAGPDQPLRPLVKIASGGEVSRVMLALKTVLGEADQVPVLVFDEVDAGIGGATAQAVGVKLSRLSRRHQVLVVTHLAQVAACADHHLVVRKEVTADGVRTVVTRVERDERVDEIARMLSGESSEASRAHAEELLRNAGKVRAVAE